MGKAVTVFLLVALVACAAAAPTYYKGSLRAFTVPSNKCKDKGAECDVNSDCCSGYCFGGCRMTNGWWPWGHHGHHGEKHHESHGCGDMICK
ncbi:hypothetical protein BSKO_11527 [Bryopsis sp. KO-2023]|nr:hypothetical protein BSKO_11527 [Bryopsis sp. KO-2023]